MAEKSEFELVVCEGEKALWEKALAAVFFGVAIFALMRMLYYTFIEPSAENALDDLFFVLRNGLSAVALGLFFSVTKTVLIDTDQDKLISRYHLGPFYRDRLSVVPQLEYVAVFKNQKDEFEVNLWYKGNKHYKMYCFEGKDFAMKFAETIVAKLNIDFLDATEKGNSKWIEPAAS